VFHVEMRMGMNVVREFNLTDERLWLDFLAPLMADREFVVEGHDFTPRHTRLTVYEGPELRLDQLSFGRGWQNVERTASDVTERVLARARQHSGHTPPAGEPTPEAAAPPAAVDLVRERLIGRMAAGPISAQEILDVATELMPEATDPERVAVAQRAAWALLERGAAQLTPLS
jgi:hypothetical protein